MPDLLIYLVLHDTAVVVLTVIVYDRLRNRWPWRLRLPKRRRWPPKDDGR